MSNHWPYDKITDHETQALERLTSEYDEAANLRKLVETQAERTQLLENAAWQLLTERWVPLAVGVQLDKMGAIVGEPRAGRTDVNYRSAILSRAMINRFGGEIEPLIQYGIALSDATNAIYLELHPAMIILFLQGTLTREQYKEMLRVRPAGVGPMFVSYSDGELPFGYKETLPEQFALSDGSALELTDGSILMVQDQNAGNVQPDPSDRLGFGEFDATGAHLLKLSNQTLLELSNGTILEVRNKDEPIEPTEGGVYADMFTPTQIIPELLELSDNSLFELSTGDNLELQVRTS